LISQDRLDIKKEIQQNVYRSLHSLALEMKTLDEILKILEQQRDFIRDKYKVKEIGIFGSYVRGEAKKTSDVDILVEFEKTPSLLKFIELENYLSDTLGVKVDLVEKKGLKPRIGKYILQEVVML